MKKNKSQTVTTEPTEKNPSQSPNTEKQKLRSSNRIDQLIIGSLGLKDASLNLGLMQRANQLLGEPYFSDKFISNARFRGLPNPLRAGIALGEAMNEGGEGKRKAVHDALFSAGGLRVDEVVYEARLSSEAIVIEDLKLNEVRELAKLGAEFRLERRGFVLADSADIGLIFGEHEVVNPAENEDAYPTCETDDPQHIRVLQDEIIEVKRKVRYNRRLGGMAWEDSQNQEEKKTYRRAYTVRILRGVRPEAYFRYSRQRPNAFDLKQSKKEGLLYEFAGVRIWHPIKKLIVRVTGLHSAFWRNAIQLSPVAWLPYEFDPPHTLIRTFSERMDLPGGAKKTEDGNGFEVVYNYPLYNGFYGLMWNLARTEQSIEEYVQERQAMEEFKQR